MTSAQLIRGGTVFDGLTPDPRDVDIRIMGGHIVEIGPRLPVDGSRIVDADSGWVLPGFVDAHSHADGGVMDGTGMETRALAGVTTEIVGQDGLGLSYADGLNTSLIAETIAPIIGSWSRGGYSTIGDYLRDADRSAYARVATLVPHGAVRASVMGSRHDRARPAEIVRMAQLTAAGLADGAAGVSTGLSYSPAIAADAAELISVFADLPEGTPYVTHLRDYGAGMRDAIAEAALICNSTRLSLHLSHFHVSGEEREGQGEAFLAQAKDLTTGGRPITWDTYPYTSGCTFIRAILPNTSQEYTNDELVVRLTSDAQFAADTRALIDRLGPGPTVAVGWERIRLAGLASSELVHCGLAAWDGKSVSEVAALTQRTAAEVVLDTVIATRGNACIIVDQGYRSNVIRIAEGDGHLVGSDGIMGSGIPHPRVANSFFRFLAWAEHGTVAVSPSEMVARMTRKVAQRFGLQVGALAVGMPADILVVDPREIEEGPETGTYRPRAVRTSLIGGERVVENGLWKGKEMGGLALRSRSTQQ